MNNTKKLLLVCGDGSSSSLLAQAAFDLSIDNLSIVSAEVEQQNKTHPVVEKLLDEMKIDKSHYKVKPVEQALQNNTFDIVVALDSVAAQHLPLRIRGNPYRLRWDIGNLSNKTGDADAEEKVFRGALEQIRLRVSELGSRLDFLFCPSKLHNQPGIATGLWAKEVLSSRHIELVAKAGFKAVEISPYSNAQHFDFRNTEQIKEIRKAGEDNGVAIWSLHSRDVGDLSSPDFYERQTQIDHLHYCLDAADMLGSVAVVSHIQAIGKYFLDLQSAENHLADGMKRLEPRAKISNARLAIENGYAFETGKWTHEIIKRVDPFSPDAFGYVIDTGHANIAGDMDDIEAQIKERLITLHLNDNAGKDSHWICGEGTVDWKRVANFLHSTNYDGCLMWEIGNPKDYFNINRINRIMDGHKRFMDYMA